MPALNINAGAKGNPLDALLAGRPIWGSTGAMLGGAGSLRPGGGEGDIPVDPNMIYGNDPNYQALQQSLMRNGVQYSQLRDTTIGGPGQAIDPGKVIYDPTLGLIAPTSDIKDPGQGTFWDQYGGFLMLGGAAALGIAGAGAAAAGEGASVGSGADAFAGSTGELTGGTGAGLAGAGGAGGTGATLDGPGAFAGSQAGAEGSTNILSTLQNLNRIRQGVGLLSGKGQSGSGSTGGGNMGSGALGGLMSLLGLGALGRQSGLFGGGVGTPGGAQAVGDRASAMADPWGTSGLRGQAQGMLTPGVMMQLLGLNPGGTQADITKDPGYQFALSQGMGALNTGAAAQGTLRSGNQLLDLQKYGTGLAAQYEGQFRGENLSTLGALSGMAGMTGSSPTAAAQSQIGAFEGATSLQNSGLNGLLGTLLNGTGAGGIGGGLGSLLSALGGGLTSILGGGSDAVSSFFSSLFGDGASAFAGSSGDLTGGAADLLGGLAAG